MAKRRALRKKKMPEPFMAPVLRQSHEGRGIVEHQERVVFVTNALIGETVEVHMHNRWKGFGEGRALRVEDPSPDRVEPVCPHFNYCGGCALQHWKPEQQIEFKSGVLNELLQHHGGDRLRTRCRP